MGYVERIQYIRMHITFSPEFLQGRNPLRKPRRWKKGAIMLREMNEGFVVDSSGVGHLWVAGCCGYVNDLRFPQKEGNFLVSHVPVRFEEGPYPLESGFHDACSHKLII